MRFVYVIGLHAVQFGSPRNFSHPIISKLDKHVVLLPIYRASKNSLLKAKLNVRAKTIQFILNSTVCAVVRFCYHSYDYRPNWTPHSPITINYSMKRNKLFSNFKRKN